MIETGRSIGLRFFLASFVPGFVAVLLGWAIIMTGAFTGPPSTTRLVDAIAGLDIGSLTLLSLGAVLAALIMHPFQTVLIKGVEGYRDGYFPPGLLVQWGHSRHLRETIRLDQQVRALRQAEGGKSSPFDQERDVRRVLEKATDRPESIAEIRQGLEAQRDLLPLSGRTMPSRLGNTLRMWEDFSGLRYGLHAVFLSPHFAAVSPDISPKLEDARYAMERSLALAMVFLLLATESGIAFFDDGPWLLTMTAFTGLAWMAYTGAVHTAGIYGDLAAVNVDLHRSDVLSRFGYPMPKDVQEEQLLFKILERQIAGKLTPTDVAYLRDRSSNNNA